MEKNVGGIRELRWPIGALVVVDVKKEHVAVKEAKSAGIPIVALVDTNSDPVGISYVIPTNDDAPRAIEVILDYLAEAVKRGQAVAAETAMTREAEGFAQENTLEKMLETVLRDDEASSARKRADSSRRPAARRSGPARPARRTS